MSEVVSVATRVRVLSPAEVAEREPAEPVDEPDDFDGSPSPQVYVVASFSARLDDGRSVDGPVEARIGTGLSEADATEESLREVIESSLGPNWTDTTIDPLERWDRLIDRLAEQGVTATPEQLDAAEHDLALDLGHLA